MELVSSAKLLKIVVNALKIIDKFAKFAQIQILVLPVQEILVNSVVKDVLSVQILKIVLSVIMKIAILEYRVKVFWEVVISVWIIVNIV